MTKERFLQKCLKEGYFQSHDRVLIALSGGLDSMTLLDYLYTYRQILGIELGIVHVNHKQRLASDLEEQSLKEIARKLGVEFFTSSFSGKFSENNARQFRYHFFQEMMREKGYTALVTAHHADDQAETIFMRLLRGSRLRFLVGMVERQPFGTGELIRPLLFFHKSEFPPIFHFEDESNSQNTYLRNRIRNHYFKDLKQENPRLIKALLDLGNQTATLYQALDDLTKDMDVQNLTLFHKQSFAVQSFLLESYCQTFPDLQLSKEQFQEVLEILQMKKTYHHPLKSGYELFKNENYFEIRKISPQPDSQKRSVLLEYGQELLLAGFTFSFGKPLLGEEVDVYLVSRETPILLRNRQAQDKIVLNGITKKIRRYFIDQKIPKNEREEAIILEQNGQILGIAGMVTSDLSKFLKSDIMNSKLYIQRNR